MSDDPYTSPVWETDEEEAWWRKHDPYLRSLSMKFPFLSVETLISFFEGGGATWKDALVAAVDLINYAKDQLSGAAFAACPHAHPEGQRAWLVETLKAARDAHAAGAAAAIDWKSMLKTLLSLLAGLL